MNNQNNRNTSNQNRRPSTARGVVTGRTSSNSQRAPSGSSGTSSYNDYAVNSGTTGGCADNSSGSSDSGSCSGE